MSTEVVIEVKPEHVERLREVLAERYATYQDCATDAMKGRVAHPDEAIRYADLARVASQALRESDPPTLCGQADDLAHVLGGYLRDTDAAREQIGARGVCTLSVARNRGQGCLSIPAAIAATRT